MSPRTALPAVMITASGAAASKARPAAEGVSGDGELGEGHDALAANDVALGAVSLGVGVRYQLHLGR